MAFQWVYLANIRGAQGAQGPQGLPGDIHTTDPRLMETGEETEVGWSVLDAHGRRTEMELGTDGQVPPRVLERWASRMPAPGQSAALPTLNWAHWGDSLTDNLVLGADAWPAQMATLTGRDHYNGGWYGEQAGQIAARQGGLPALVTVSSNTIPASGAVSVTSIVNNPVEPSASRQVTGTLAGVHGAIKEATAGSVTFTRTSSGVAVECPPGSRFIPDVAATLRDRHVTVWAGRNDVYFTDANIIVGMVRAMVDYLSSPVKRVLVLEIPPSETEVLGSGTRALVEERNNALKAAFPAEWVSVATFLRTSEAATAAGITFTTQDNTDISNGITPTSFRSDGVHLNAAGAKAVAYKVHKEAQKRGWLV